MQIRNMRLEDYREVDRLMAQVHKLHLEGRPDLYIDVWMKHAVEKVLEENCLNMQKNVPKKWEQNEWI